MSSILRFLKDESGPTAVEYAVMLAMILVVCIGSVTLFGQSTAANFATTAEAIGSAMGK